MEEILVGLDPTLPRRTLQYRLSWLAKNGLLISERKIKGRRFKLPQKEIKQIEIIPLSKNGESIQGWVSQPIYLRKSVSYDREFLGNMSQI